MLAVQEASIPYNQDIITDEPQVSTTLLPTLYKLAEILSPYSSSRSENGPARRWPQTTGINSALFAESTSMMLQSMCFRTVPT
jgi:hypothetical protein